MNQNDEQERKRKENPLRHSKRLMGSTCNGKLPTRPVLYFEKKKTATSSTIQCNQSSLSAIATGKEKSCRCRIDSKWFSKCSEPASVTKDSLCTYCSVLQPMRESRCLSAHHQKLAFLQRRRIRLLRCRAAKEPRLWWIYSSQRTDDDDDSIFILF